MTDQNQQAQLPPLDVCPEELRHGYPECDCDLVGGDSECKKTPTLAELRARYDPLKQRERQLLQAMRERDEARDLISRMDAEDKHYEEHIANLEAALAAANRRAEEAIAILEGTVSRHEIQAAVALLRSINPEQTQKELGR